MWRGSRGRRWHAAQRLARANGGGERGEVIGGEIPRKPEVERGVRCDAKIFTEEGGR